MGINENRTKEQIYMLFFPFSSYQVGNVIVYSRGQKLTNVIGDKTSAKELSPVDPYRICKTAEIKSSSVLGLCETWDKSVE